MLHASYCIIVNKIYFYSSFHAKLFHWNRTLEQIFLKVQWTFPVECKHLKQLAILCTGNKINGHCVFYWGRRLQSAKGLLLEISSLFHSAIPCSSPDLILCHVFHFSNKGANMWRSYRTILFLTDKSTSLSAKLLAHACDSFLYNCTIIEMETAWEPQGEVISGEWCHTPPHTHTCTHTFERVMTVREGGIKLLWISTHETTHCDAVMIWDVSCSCLSVYGNLLFFISYPSSCTLVILFHASHIPVILPCTHVFSPVTSMSRPMSVLHCLRHGTFLGLTVSGALVLVLPLSFIAMYHFNTLSESDLMVRRVSCMP